MAGKIIGKADSRYWLQSGKLFADPRGNGALSCRIQVQGRREPFPLRTNNKATAAAKAAKIYGDVVAFGWTEALAKHKPEAAKPSKGSTVGELISAVSELSSVRPATLRGYAGALRRIVAEVEGIKANKGRFARCGAGRGAWLTAVDAVTLAKLTPDRIEAWKLRYVSSRAGRNETKTRTTRNSANTCLRQAKGLFAKRLLRLISNRIELPTPLPFDGVDFFPRQSMRYTSTMDVGMVISSARDELAKADPEAFKAFTLCLFAGLRRNEADKLRWQSVDFTSGAIRIETQDDFAPKAETSLGDIPIDKEICTILRGVRAREPKAEYVMAASIEEPKGKLRAARQKALSWSRYRAADTFKRLADWLRTHGVDSRTPLHTLRKEAGSLICQKHGLFAASRFLRHADVGITAQHYAAQKERVTIGLGAMLTGEHHSGEPLLLRIACFFFGELSESQDARTPLAAFELVEYFEQWAILPLAPDAAEIAAGRIGCVHRCVVLNTLRSVAIHEFKVRLHQELSASMIRIITRRAGWAKVPRLCYA